MPEEKNFLPGGGNAPQSVVRPGSVLKPKRKKDGRVQTLWRIVRSPKGVTTKPGRANELHGPWLNR